MALCLRLGRTLGELQDTMSASELMMWAEYDRISPIGDVRSDILNAQLVSAIYGSQGVKVPLDEAQLKWASDEETQNTSSDPFAGIESALRAIST